jgi:hypothetical protein
VIQKHPQVVVMLKTCQYMLWITKLFVEKYPQMMNIDLEKVMIEKVYGKRWPKNLSELLWNLKYNLICS